MHVGYGFLEPFFGVFSWTLCCSWLEIGLGKCASLDKMKISAQQGQKHNENLDSTSPFYVNKGYIVESWEAQAEWRKSEWGRCSPNKIWVFKPN